MAAPKGNTYWKLAKGWKKGNYPAYTPDELWQKACDYFDWVEKHPYKEEKVFGSGFRTTISKMRPTTQKSFCIFAQISSTTFDNYHANEAYFGITSRIKDIIYVQKFEGAAAGQLNSNLIARELRLAEKVQTEVSNIHLMHVDPITEIEALNIKKMLERKY
jgi:hypothetical protein